MEKLKLLLFDNDQHYLFEHIPKPFLLKAKSAKSTPKNTALSDEEAPTSSPKDANPDDLLRANDIWAKNIVQEDEKLNNYCSALENVMDKRNNGELNVIDRRLLEILNIPDID